MTHFGYRNLFEAIRADMPCPACGATVPANTTHTCEVDRVEPSAADVERAMEAVSKEEEWRQMQ